MRWFRTNLRLGGRLALFALAVQLVLSFGHIHLEDIYGNARAFAASSASAAMPAADNSQPPPASKHSNHTDDYCAICATVHLLGSSFAAQAPQLPLPFISASIVHFDRVAFVFATTRRAPFQSRAPPQA
jgi:hypothetical protein